MSMYTIPTTTSYSLESQNILSITTDTDPSPFPLSAKDYLTILGRILVPPSVNGTTSLTDKQLRDADNINSLVYAITWMHRTFLKSFPSDRISSISNLHNLLAVPVQFSVTARTYANYSQTLFQLPLPETMRTTATGGKSRSRLKIQQWAGWLFIGADLAVHAGMVAGIVWILFLRDGEPLPPDSAFKEIQVVREADKMEVVQANVDTWPRLLLAKLGWLTCCRISNSSFDEDGKSEKIPLLQFSRECGGDNDLSAFKLAKSFRRVRVIRDVFRISYSPLDVANCLADHPPSLVSRVLKFMESLLTTRIRHIMMISLTAGSEQQKSPTI